jgi:hypothetical protein
MKCVQKMPQGAGAFLTLIMAMATVAGPVARNASAQEAAAKTTGSVTGRVFYSDDKAPARLAQVLLVKLTPAKPPGGGTGAATGKQDLQSMMGSLSRGLDTFAQTGLEGHFEMADVPAGKYIVLAQQNGAVNPLSHIDLGTLNGMKMGQVSEDQIKEALPYLTIVTVDPGKTVDVTVSLTHGASISGVVTYDDGSPAVGVKVQLMSKTRDGSYEEPNMMTLGMASSNSTLIGYMTDDAGRFRIAGLAAGTYGLRASLPLNALKNLGNKLKSVMILGMTSPDALAASSQVDDGLSVYSGNVFFKKDLKPIELTASEAYTGADITIPADGMHKVQVHVEEMTTGNAIELAQVQLLDANGKDTLRSGYVDDHGDCTFDYVPEGQYTLQVVNAVDASGMGKMGSGDFNPKNVVRYGPAKTKVSVTGDISNIVLQVAKIVPAENKASQ